MGAPIQILMATYNGERYLETQLESLMVQDHTDFELLVSDDGSSDATRSILKRYAKADPRIRILDAGRRLGGARNNFLWLLSQADSPYVAFCDQDDLWLSDKLGLEFEKMRALEATHGQDAPLLVFSDLAVVAEDLSVMSPSFMSYSGLDESHTDLGHLLVQNLAPGCTIIANRSLYRETFRLPEDISSVSMHDWWLMLTAAALGHIGYVDQPTMLYRQHGHNTIGAEREGALDILRRLGNYVDRLVPTAAQLDTIDVRLKQAAAFVAAYGERLSETDSCLCKNFASLLGRSPLERVLWCHRNGVCNATALMQLGMDWELLLYDVGRRTASSDR